MKITSSSVHARPSVFGRVVLVPVFLGAVVLAIAAPSCASPDDRTIILGDAPDGAPPTSFTTPDAGTEPTLTLTEYCPTTGCPAPYTTCSTSQFPCDVNLMTDSKNCGSCGFECKGSGNALFDCVGGACTFRCKAETHTFTADCNGVIDDDCEVALGTNDNCNGCGDKCTDPAKPCIFDDGAGTGECGCGPDRLYCGSCIDPSTSDQHCGACGHACDPSGGDGGAPPAHAHYGCVKKQCGQLKCDRLYADCDQDPSNGCETSIQSMEHCGACNTACSPGQVCGTNARGEASCLCPPGQTLCGSSCVDLGTDPTHCGACSVSCLMIGQNKNGVGTCNYGSCTYECQQGWGDCNGNPSDGCEVNLNSDQRHCGACGNACDALAGQPCIGGQCAVHACLEGEVVR